MKSELVTSSMQPCSPKYQTDAKPNSCEHAILPSKQVNSDRKIALMSRYWKGGRVNPVVYVVFALNLPLILLLVLSQVGSARSEDLSGEVIGAVDEGFAAALNDGVILYDTLPAAFVIPDGRAPYFTEVAWTKNPLTYRFINCPPPEQLDCGAALQVMRDSMEAWDNISGITLNETTEFADINVLFQYNQETNFFPDGPGGILGLTYFPYPEIGELGGDVAFDGSESWYINNPTNPNVQVHLPTVAMHEFGHALGLNHSADFDALMWAEYTGPRPMTSDDVAGMQALYGPPNPDEPQPGPPLAEPEPTPVPESAVPVDFALTAVSQVNLNIRDFPGTGGVALGLLPANTPVPAVGRNDVGTWIVIIFNDLQGWVSADFITLDGDLSSLPVTDGLTPVDVVPPSSPEVEPVDAPAGTVFANSNANAIRIRIGPGTDFAQVARLDPQTLVPVVGRNTSGDWLLVEYQPGQRGWIAAWTVTIEGDLSQVPIIQ